MYTPDDLSETEFIEDDRPYAGVLLLTYGHSKTRSKDYYYFEIGGGILGENSLAGDLQKLIHEASDSTIPMGWDNQIEKGFVFTINSTYKNRVLDYNYFELIPYSGFEVGNLFDYYKLGIEPKLGYNIPESFEDHIIQPTSFDTSDLSVYVYGIGESRFVLYNATLKGLDIEHIVLDYGAGIKLIYGKVGINFTYIFRTKEFSQGKEQNYSSLTLEFKI